MSTDDKPFSVMTEFSEDAYPELIRRVARIVDHQWPCILVAPDGEDGMDIGCVGLDAKDAVAVLADVLAALKDVREQ